MQRSCTQANATLISAALGLPYSTAGTPLCFLKQIYESAKGILHAYHIQYGDCSGFTHDVAASNSDTLLLTWSC